MRIFEYLCYFLSFLLIFFENQMVLYASILCLLLSLKFESIRAAQLPNALGIIFRIRYFLAVSLLIDRIYGPNDLRRAAKKISGPHGVGF